MGEGNKYSHYSGPFSIGLPQKGYNIASPSMYMYLRWAFRARRKSFNCSLFVGCDDFQVQVKLKEGDIPTKKIEPFKSNT